MPFVVALLAGSARSFADVNFAHVSIGVVLEDNGQNLPSFSEQEMSPAADTTAEDDALKTTAHTSWGVSASGNALVGLVEASVQASAGGGTMQSMVSAQAEADLSDHCAFIFTPAAAALVHGANLVATVQGGFDVSAPMALVNAGASMSFIVSANGATSTIFGNSQDGQPFPRTLVFRLPDTFSSPQGLDFNMELSTSSLVRTALASVHANALFADTGVIDGFEMLDASGQVLHLPPRSVTITSRSGHSFSVIVDQPGQLPGDANLDGQVNFPDLLAVAQHYGQSGEWITGDFNGDRSVGFDDLLILAQHYGQSLGGTPTAPVPEPETISLAATLSVLARRQWKNAASLSLTQSVGESDRNFPAGVLRSLT